MTAITTVLQKVRDTDGHAVLARGAVGAFLVNAFTMAMTVGMQMVLARVLGDDQYGIYIYALTWLNVLMVLGTFGMDTTSLRFVAAYNGKKEWGALREYLSYSTCSTVRLSLAVALLVAGLIWFFRGSLSADKSSTFWLGCLLLPVTCLIRLGGAQLQAFKQVVPSQILQGISRPIVLVAGLALIHFLFAQPVNAPVAMALNVFAAGVTWLLLGVLLRGFLPPKNASAGARELHPQWWSAAKSLFLINCSQTLVAYADILLIGMFVDTTRAGIYAVASRIATLITFGITSVNSILAPILADLHARDKRQELQETVTMAARGVLIYTAVVVCVLLLAGKWLLSLLGADFVQGYPVLAILAIGQLVIGAAGSVGFLMTMTGHQREATWVIGGSAVLAVLLNLWLIPHFGILGAASATTLATSFRSLALSFMVQKRLNIVAHALGSGRGPRRVLS